MEFLTILAMIGTIVLGSFGICYWTALSISQIPSIVNEPTEEIKNIGFWRRQFQLESTPNQKIFDWTFGVVLPVVCFAFDPIIFKGNGSFGGFAKPFAYLLSFTSIMAMMAWLIWGEKLKWLNGILSGLFAVGGIISLGIGIVMFPLSVIGLVFVIGILGFTPLFTSLVFLRNASRTYRFAKPFMAKRVLLGTAVLSAMFSFVIPLTINAEIQKLLSGIKTGNVATIKRNAKVLKFLAPITNFSDLKRSYYGLQNQPDKQKVLADAFKAMTGESITDYGDTFID
jgi:hypothetical protein